VQYIDDSLAKQELCLQWSSQAGAWEPETKVFGGTGILPVGRTGETPVLLNLSFWFFDQDFILMLLI
jgi:hypothetical protein